MRTRRGTLAVLAAVLGAGVVALPALAGSETAPAIEAVNVGGGIYGEEHHWSPASATIAPGASITVSNAGEVPHGIHWIAPPSTPTCTAGVPVGTTPGASGTKWSGSCTFTTAGTYRFYCTVHGAAMSGVVTVTAPESPGGTTTTTTTPTAPPGGTSEGAGSGPGAQGEEPLAPLLAGTPSSAVKVGAGAHGRSVHGSVDVTAAGAGSRLQVDVLTRASQLARGAARSPAGTGPALSRAASAGSPIRIGHLVRESVHRGSVPFALALSARALRALSARGQLTVTVKISLVQYGRTPVRIARVVHLRR
jgi:plastocyanin